MAETDEILSRVSAIHERIAARAADSEEQLGGAVLDMARRALELHVERTRTRREVYTKNAKAEHAGTQSRIAESAAEALSAELSPRPRGGRVRADRRRQ